jgi:hypothetical protein
MCSTVGIPVPSGSGGCQTSIWAYRANLPRYAGQHRQTAHYHGCMLRKAAFLVLLSPIAVHAAGVDAIGVGVSVPIQPNDCVAAAAAYHQQNPWVVRAILQVESSFNPKAYNRNKNGTYDIGIAQINSMHLKELSQWGIGPSELQNACVGAYVASWHLGKQMRAYGHTWKAIGAYHSSTACHNERYQKLVWNVLVGWGVVNGKKLAVPAMASCGARSGSVKSSSKDHPTMLAFDTP